MLLLAFGVSSVLQSQPLCLKLWNDKPPGSIDDPSYRERVEVSDSGERVSQVTEPTLTIYFAPKEKTSGTAVLILPGGGYAYVTTTKEGTKIAQWLSDNGITAAVLKYRLPADNIMKEKSIGPLQDAQEALRVLRRHAREWNINPNKIGVMGFSAGGHLAATLSTRYSEHVYEPVDTISARPDFSVLVYPVISFDSSITHRGSRERLIGTAPASGIVEYYSNELQVRKDTPPAILFHAMDDGAVPVENSIRYFTALKKNGIPAELHIYQSGGHGFGLGRGGTEASWTDACLRWFIRNGWK